MKLAIYTLSSAVAITNAQLLSISRLRSSASKDEWGRHQPRRVQVQRVLEESMSLSMSMDFDASISFPSFGDSSVSLSLSTSTSTSISMSVESELFIPEEPEIILNGGVPVVFVEPAPADTEGDSESETTEETEESLDDNVPVDGDEEEFVDGDFKEQKLEANVATSSVARSALATLLAVAYAFINMV